MKTPFNALMHLHSNEMVVMEILVSQFRDLAENNRKSRKREDENLQKAAACHILEHNQNTYPTEGVININSRQP